MPFKILRRVTLANTLAGRFSSERIRLKDLQVTDADFRNARFHLDTFGNHESSYPEIFLLLQRVRDGSYGRPKLFGQDNLPDFNGFKLLPRHLVLLAHGLKNKLESDHVANLDAAPFYKKPAIKIAFNQFRLGAEELLDDMREVLANLKLRSQVRDEILGYSGKYEQGSKKKVVYSREEPGRPKESPKELGLATVEDFVEKHLGERPSDLDHPLTPQQTQWFLDADHPRLGLLENKLSDLYRDLGNHHAGFISARTFVSEFNTPYALALLAEVGQELTRTYNLRQKVHELLFEVKKTRTNPEHEPRLP